MNEPMMKEEEKEQENVSELFPSDMRAAVETIKEICKEIGCSGLNPDMCKHAPHRCSIIRKVIQAA